MLSRPRCTLATTAGGSAELDHSGNGLARATRVFGQRYSSVLRTSTRSDASIIEPPAVPPPPT